MTLSATLEAAPAVRLARAALAGRAEVWLVGGAIREAALDRQVIDADLAVSEGEREAARAIAAHVGGIAFALSAEHGAWRVEPPDRAWHVDVSRLRAGGIEADLALRDFTVNALAVPLADLAATPLDPTGGLADLERRLLRAASKQGFSDDPLRLLRAARLASVLGLKLEPATVELARQEAGRAAEPAGERQLAELRRLVTGPDPLRGLSLLDELGVTAEVLPELQGLKGVEQNPNHHLDVYGHTIEVVRNLLVVEGNLERYAGAAASDVRALLAEPLADEFTRGGALRFGAVLHDVGKPATRRQRDGFVTFVGHDREGATLVRGVCERLKASRALRRHLQGLTLHHLHLGFMSTERPLPRRRLYEYLRTTEPVAADVTLLTVADRLAARGAGPTASAEMIEGHLELAREVLPAALEWHRSGPPRGPLSGNELAAEVGIEPGPELGRLLAEVEAAVFCNQVSSRDEAIELARRVVGD